MTDTLNPSGLGTGLSLSGGNLTATQSGNNWGTAWGCKPAQYSGKWYFEVDFSTISGVGAIIGISQSTSVSGGYQYLGGDNQSFGYQCSGVQYYNGGSTSSGLSWSSGATVGVAIDLVNNKIWIQNSSGWVGGGNPATNTGGTTIPFALPVRPAFSLDGTGGVGTVNFGGSGFTLAMPAGFLAWGASDPLYVQGDRVQETTTTSGTGTITLAGAVTQFQSFNAGIGLTNLCGYTILHSNGTDWEVGEGIVGGGSGAYTLTRNLKSSSTGSLLSLSGTSTVFSTQRGGRSPYSQPLYDISAGVPALSTFTWINQQTATAQEYPGRGIGMLQGADSGSGNAYHLLGVSAPTTPYRVAILLQFFMPVSQYQVVCVGAYDGTKLQMMNFQGNNSSTCDLTVSHFSGPSTYVGTDFATYMFPSSPVWFGLRDDGTYFYFEISADGATWATVWKQTKSGAYISNFNTICWGIQDVPSGSNVLQSAATLRCWDVNGLTRTL